LQNIIIIWYIKIINNLYKKRNSKIQSFYKICTNHEILCEFSEFFLFLNIFEVQWVLLFDVCLDFFWSFVVLLELELMSRWIKCIIFRIISKLSLLVSDVEEFEVDLCLSCNGTWVSLTLLLWILCGFRCFCCLCCSKAMVILLLCCRPPTPPTSLLDELFELFGWLALTIGLFFGGDFE